MSRAFVEGYTAEELAALPRAEVEALVFGGRPVVLRVGAASVLSELRVEGEVLVVELAHLDGGGDGALVALWSAAARLAGAWGLREVERLVHAIACARPNDRLQATLLRRGFAVEVHPRAGEVLRLVRPVQPLGA